MRNRTGRVVQKAASTDMNQIGATLAGKIAALFLYIHGPNHFLDRKGTLFFVVISYHRQTIGHKINIQRDSTDPHHQTMNNQKITCASP